MRFININTQNEIIGVYTENHLDKPLSAIEITDIDFAVIKANGFRSCSYTNGIVVYSQSRVDANLFIRQKESAIYLAIKTATNELIMAKAAPTIAKIGAIDNKAALDIFDTITDVKGNP